MSAFAFCVALIALAISRQIPALDFGWLNAAFMLIVWIGVTSSLKQILVDDAAPTVRDAVSRRMAVSTLEYRRR
jgi:hypothetical protein